MMSDQFGIGFKIFLIVELTKLGGHKIKFLKWKIFSFVNGRSFGTDTLKAKITAHTHSKVTITGSF